jgi:hypothetical protein
MTNKTVQLDYLKHKRRRGIPSTEFVDRENGLSSIQAQMNPNENLVINLIDEEYTDINIVNNDKDKICSKFEEQIKILKTFFWNAEPFYCFKTLDDYEKMINYFFNNILDVPPHLKHPLKKLSDILFDFEINKNIISLNKIEDIYTETIRFYKNSLFIYIFKQLEHIFNNKKNINKICLVGEKGMGKSYALMLISLFLRINPYNLVFTIFNFEEFMHNPLQYFTNEVIHSLYYLYANNTNLDMHELEKFYSFYNLKNSNDAFINNYKTIFENFKKMCENVLKAYEGKINIFIILDNYQDIYSNNGKLKLEIVEFLENFKFSDNLYQTKIKIITCTNTENNEIILQKFKEAKNFNDFECLDNRILFLDAKKHIREEELMNFIEKRFSFPHKTAMKSMVKYSGHNYNYLLNFFECVTMSQYEEFLYLKENHIKTFFIDLKKREFNRLIDSVDISLEKKAYTLYSLFSYRSNYEKRNLENTHSKYDFISKEIYKNYVYKYVFPEIKNNNIVFNMLNDLVIDFLLNFCYEEYFRKLKLKKMSMKSYAEWYNQTNDHYLKGIYIEELTFLFFKNSKFFINNDYPTVLYHKLEKFNFYSKGNIILPYEEEDFPDYSKVNNIENLNVTGENIIFKIEKVKKFYSADDQIFGGDKILKFSNGLYFLNPKFPIIDAFIINQERKNIVLIQIKKTIEQKVIDKYFDDFHILYFLLEKQEMYRKIVEIQMNENLNSRQKSIDTKLQLFLKLAHYIKLGWSINFMFTYRYIDNNISFGQDNQSIENHYTYDRDMEAAKFVLEDESFVKTERTLGLFQIDNKIITLYRRRILHNVIMVELNDLTNGLIEKKKFSNFIK